MLKRLAKAMGLDTDSRAIRIYIRYLAPSRALLLGASALLLVTSCLQLATPMLTGYIIDQILARSRSSVLNIIAPALFLVTASFLGAMLLRSWLLARLKFRLEFRMQRDLLRHLQQLSFTYTATKETGYLMARLLDDTQTAYDFATNEIVSFLQQVFMLLTASTVLAWISWRMALVSVLIVPIYILIGSHYIPRLRTISRDVLEKLALRDNVLCETIAGMYTVNVCGMEPSMLKRFVASQISYIQAEMQSFWLGSKVATARSFVSASGPLVVLWFGGLQVIHGVITIGELVAFSSIFSYLFSAAQQLSATHLSFQKLAVSTERIAEILCMRPQIKEAWHPVFPTALTRGIEFRDVAFTYNNGKAGLNGLTLSVPVQKITAIVGRSGAGKTTLVHLLMRFYDPQRGTILIDETPLNAVPLKWLRRTVALVPQDVCLFSMSVEANILLGKPNATRDEVVQAARLANAHQFIQELPKGYDTSVGERGISLSGGQRQRIAIARAMLKEPQVLILDEGVSGVDDASEQAFCETLRQLIEEKGLTVIMITHRHSTMREADIICVIDEGRTAATGDDRELRGTCSLYENLICLQSAEATLARPGKRILSVAGAREVFL